MPDDALLSRDFSIESRDFSILDRCKFCSSTAFFKDCRDPDSLEEDVSMLCINHKEVGSESGEVHFEFHQVEFVGFQIQ